MDNNKTVLTPDEARRIAIDTRNLHGGPSDTVSGPIYVMAGAQAVLAKLPGMPAEEWVYELESRIDDLVDHILDTGSAQGHSRYLFDRVMEHAQARIQPAASEADQPKCHKCGMPMIRNPHPDAGQTSRMLEVGCPLECLPCTVLSRHQWSQRALKAEKSLREAGEAGAVPPELNRVLHADEEAPTKEYMGYLRGWNECRDWVIRHAGPAAQPEKQEGQANDPTKFFKPEALADAVNTMVRLGYKFRDDGKWHAPAAQPEKQAAQMGISVPFLDQSMADPLTKARRVLTRLADGKDFTYFFDDGFPRARELAQDATATLAVLNALAAPPAPIQQAVPAAESAEPANEDQRAAVEFYRLNPSAAVFDLHRRLTDPAKPTSATADAIPTDNKITISPDAPSLTFATADVQQEIRCPKCELEVLANCDPDGRWGHCPLPKAHTRGTRLNLIEQFDHSLPLSEPKADAQGNIAASVSDKAGCISHSAGSDKQADAQGDERSALQTLVDLEDMRLRLRGLHERGHGTDYDDYHKSLPKAWERARAALSRQPSAVASTELLEVFYAAGNIVPTKSEAYKFIAEDDTESSVAHIINLKCRAKDWCGFLQAYSACRAALAAARPEGGNRE